MSNEIAIMLSLRTAGALNELNSFLNKTTSSLKTIALTVGSVFAVGATLDKIKDGVREAINLQEAVGKLRLETGLAIPVLSAFKEGGEEIGTEFNEMRNSLGRFSQNVYEAMTKGGEAGKTFQKMGVSLVDMNGAARNVNDVMKDTVKWFAQQEAGVQKTKFAVDLFGKTGRELIPIFDSVNDKIGFMEAGGGVFSEESVRRAYEFNKRLREIGDQFEEIYQKVAFELIPIINRLLSAIMKIDFKAIGNGLADLVAGIGQAIDEGKLDEVIGDSLKLGVDMFIAYLPGALAKMGTFIIKAFESPLTWIQARMQFVFSELQFYASDQGRKMMEEQRAARAKADAATPAFGVLFASDEEKAKMKAAWQDYFEEEAAIKKKYREQYQAQTFDEILKERREEGLKFDFGSGEFGISEMMESSNESLAKATAKREGLLKNFMDKMRDFKSRMQSTSSPAIPGSSGEQSPFFPGPSDSAVRDMSQWSKLLTEINNQNREAINKNPFATQVEKIREMLPLLRQQQELVLRQYDKAFKAFRDGDDDTKLATLQQLVQLQDQYNGLKREEQKLASQNTFTGEFRMAIKEIQDEWGSWAKQSAAQFKGVFSGAVGTISNGLTGVIMKTKSWNEALADIGTTILTSIISSIIEMGVRWVATQLMMMIFGQSMAAASTALITPIAAAQAAIWSGPATLATIASYGGAALAAPGAIAFAQGAVLATSAIPREFGGDVQAGQPYIVGEKRPELFIPSESGRILPEVPRPTQLGSNSQQGAGRGSQNIHIHLDRQLWKKALRNDPDAIGVDGFNGANRVREGFQT